MVTRAETKAVSQQRILQAAGARLRQEGLGGAGIADVMRDAGLTHGAFYAHFANKSELAAAALRHALLDNRARWVGELKNESWIARLQRLAQRYLTRNHRDNPAEGCAFASLATEAARGDQAFRSAFEAELLKSIQAICNGATEHSSPPDDKRDEALALMALCVGGLSLSRAVADEELSSRILRVCANAAGRVASREEPIQSGLENGSHAITPN